MHTVAVTPRTLEALPTGTYHHMGSVGSDQVVISQKLPVGKLVDSSAETQIRLMDHLSKKIWDLDMPGLLYKFCTIINTIKLGHLLDDLPFALWLVMIPTVRVESKGLWGRLSLCL